MFFVWMSQRADSADKSFAADGRCINPSIRETISESIAIVRNAGWLSLEVRIAHELAAAIIEGAGRPVAARLGAAVAIRRNTRYHLARSTREWVKIVLALELAIDSAR